MTKTASNPTTAACPVTIHRPSVEQYSPAYGTLIPLHAHDSTTARNGTIRKDGKRPVHNDWTNREYPPADVVIAHCVKKNLNVGVRLPADVVVIDIDPRNGGNEGWDNFCMELGLDPSTYVGVLTGGGGIHYYFDKPADVAVVDTVKGFAGVEFKSKGRQVVAAGSIHPETGNLYTFIGEDPLPAKPPTIPDNLLRMITRPQRSAITSGGQLDQAQVEAVLARLDPCDFPNNDTWEKLMMAIHHASHGEARQEWIDWSISNPKYAHHAELIGRRWDSLHTDKAGQAIITIGTLRKILSDHNALDALPADHDAARAAFEGQDDPDYDCSGKNEVIPIERRGIKVKNNSKAEDTYTNAINAVLRSDLDPAWDEMSQTAVLRHAPWGTSHGFVLNDHTLRFARVFLSEKFQGNAYEPAEKHVFDALMAVAYRNKFNPVLDYLAGLTWDGVPRLDRLFGDYFHCGDTPYTRAVSACFAIGAVRRMREPGCKLDTMPVVKGPQGWGKSTGVQALSGRQWFTDADMGSLKDKDAAMKLRGVWVVELAELESLSKPATGDLKAFMSRATDRQRDPYGRIVEDHPRRCSFIGTVNESGYLKDSTGARRFWPLELMDRVDVARIKADRDQLWAEAAAREAAGESTFCRKRYGPWRPKSKPGKPQMTPGWTCYGAS
jgi:hypothetical protein